MRFVNRKKEMSRLERLIHSSEAGLAVIWGRRRTGKTRLLLEWVNKNKGVYYVADESASSVQRKYFALAIEQAIPGFSAVEYPDWTALLTRLARDAQSNNWRGPLVVDELPYLIASSPELPSILQKFIDQEAKKAKLIIALCGSSQRMMQGAILNASAPLYGRAQEVIKLGPISIGYMKDVLNFKNFKEIVESYAIWGGIPRYWELAAKDGVSLIENIDDIVLDPLGPLNDEVNRLLLDEYPSAINLRPILDAIGLGAHRLSEIAARIGQPSTSITRPIQRLIELDLIGREFPFGVSEYNSKRTLYRIKDHFTRFWFDIVASRRSMFAQTSPRVRQKYLKTLLPNLFSITWEELCRIATPLLAHKWDGTSYEQAGRFWQGKGPEWDIITRSMENNNIIIGEAKWKQSIFSMDGINKAIEEMKKKGVPPIERPPHASVKYVLFIPELPKQLNVPKGVKIIDAKEVINILE